MSTTFEYLLQDWDRLIEEYPVEGVAISNDPTEALSASERQAIADAYEKDRTAGYARAAEAYSRLLHRRKAAAAEQADTLAHELGQWELRHADRREPLQDAAKRDAERFGQNLEVLHEYMGFRYDDLAQVTGISRSTVYKIARDRSTPTLSSVLQVATSFGLHVSVLLAGPEELTAWDRALGTVPLPLDLEERKLEATTEAMERRLRGDEGGEDDELYAPGPWLTDVEEAAREVARRCPSPGGVFGAVIGRHHGGEKGAYVGGYMGHRLRGAAEREDLEGFRFPGRYVEAQLKKKLNEAYWGGPAE